MKGKMGAAILCALGSLRSGAGLTTLHIPLCGYKIAQTALPEVMVELNEGKDILQGNYTSPKKKSAIAIGCGIGKDKKTQEFFYSVLKNSSSPLILDADAINILALNPKMASSYTQKKYINSSS